VPRPVTARVIVISFDLRLAVKGMAPANRLGSQFNTIRARFGRSSVKDPNWSHPGKSMSHPRRSIPVTTTSTDPKPDPSFADCCSEVTVVNEMSVSAPTDLTNFTKRGRLPLPRARPHQLGESHCGSGVRGTDLSRSEQRCIDAPCLDKFNWGAIGPAQVLYAARPGVRCSSSASSPLTQ
jgi:hypothetical protein